MRRARAFLLVVTGLLLWACDATEPSVPTTISVTPSPLAFDAAGARDTVVASVLDQRGRRIGGVPLTWSVEGTAVTVTPLGGDSAVVISTGNGQAIVRVAAEAGAVGEAVALVIQAPVTLIRLEGQGQVGIAGLPLPQPLRVAVRDRLGFGVPDVVITFSVTQGGGSLSATEVVTGQDGVSEVIWTLGTSTSGGQEVSVAAAGLAGEALFAAIATPGPPARIVPARGNDQSALVNEIVAISPAVLVSDQYGNPVAGVAVSYQVTLGGGTVTRPSGLTLTNGTFGVEAWRLGPLAGPNALRASVTGTDLATSFDAIATLTSGIAIHAGANQAAMAGTAVPVDPSVIVHDSQDRPVAGAPVIFSVVEGDGSVTNSTAFTDSNGIASTGWTLGPVAMRNRITARAMLPAIQDILITFDAGGCGGGGGVGYAITLCYTSDISSAQRQVFEGAATRWANVIIGDLPNVEADFLNPCPGGPSLQTVIDDLLIFVSVITIDGPGGVLGQAGACRIRGAGSLPYVGLMQFDRADVPNLVGNGSFQTVILHEMGHVIGIGTLWDTFGFLNNPSTSSVKLDTFFSGSAGRAAFDAIGGTAYTAGQKVPVENEGGQGTRNGHWRESVLKNELMTGFINSGSNPLSLLTVRSLEDLGYAVNQGAAEPYLLTVPLRAAGASDQSLQLVDDILDLPLWRTDGSGREVRVR